MAPTRQPSDYVSAHEAHRLVRAERVGCLRAWHLEHVQGLALDPANDALREAGRARHDAVGRAIAGRPSRLLAGALAFAVLAIVIAVAVVLVAGGWIRR